MGYGKITINEQWWKWNEEEEVLNDGRGLKERKCGKKTGEERTRIKVEENGKREKNSKKEKGSG